MAVGTNVRVTIYDRNLDALYLPGGQVWGKMQDIGTEVLRMALVEVPRRSGFLASRHNLALTPYRKRGVRFSVGNYADYASYVHEGTQSPIVPRHSFRNIDLGGGHFAAFPRPTHFQSGRVTGTLTDNSGRPLLALRPWGRYPRMYKYAVAGQAANPWIARAADIVLAKYGFVDNGFPR